MIEDLLFDVIIIGVGIFGINVVYCIQIDGLFDVMYVIFEGCEFIGGIWDLFKYFGIWLDLDIFMFGFLWSLWKYNEFFVVGDKIKDYMIELVRLVGIDNYICY